MRKVLLRVRISLKVGVKSDISVPFSLKLVPLKGLFAFGSFLKCSLLQIVNLYAQSDMSKCVNPFILPEPQNR